ncbi:MAG TPA: AMP-binding protein, partial [Anaerolineae bacterium]|nr:AMP-binding protein [Anaerolineae bacterium]
MTYEPANQDLYRPSDEIVAAANARHYEELTRRARQDLAGFWAEQAKEFVWFQEWEQTLDESDKPFYRWFVGGKTNIVYNCLDRHVNTWRRNKLALIWEGENGDLRTFSYHALNREVCKAANVLRSMGVKKGDRVTIYMSRVPELPIAMLACAKLGAVHSVVYGGFSVEALHGRIEDRESRVVITC